MIKRVIAVICIVVAITLSYRAAFNEDSFGKKFFFKNLTRIDKIVKRNIDYLPEMNRDGLIRTLDHLQTFSPDLKIKIKPLSKKRGNQILTGRRNNQKMQLTIFHDNGIFVSSQANTLFYLFLLSGVKKISTYQDIGNIHQVESYLVNLTSRRPNGPLIHLRRGYKLPPDGFLTKEERQKATDINLKRAFSIGKLYHSMVDLLNEKFNAIEADHKGNVVWKSEHRQVYKGQLNLLNSAKGAWIFAFYDYDANRHWIRKKLCYYSRLPLFFGAIVFAIFSIIQFCRPSIKKMIRTALFEQGITITHSMVNSIYWNHWEYLFYQSKNGKTRAEIEVEAQRIATEIERHNICKDAQEIWRTLSSTDLSESTRSTLEGSFRKAMSDKVSTEARKNALGVLQNHRPQPTEKLENPIEPKAREKRGRGEGIKDLLKREITAKCDVDPKKLIGLSQSSHYEFLRVINILPMIHPFALDAFLGGDFGQLLKNDAFCRAISNHDRKRILAYLEINEESPAPTVSEDEVDPTILRGARVLITSGRAGYSKRENFLMWVEEMGAESAKYTPGDSKKLGDSIGDVNVIILVLPLGHPAQLTAMATHRQIVWANHSSDPHFKKDITRQLRNEPLRR